MLALQKHFAALACALLLGSAVAQDAAAPATVPVAAPAVAAPAANAAPVAPAAPAAPPADFNKPYRRLGALLRGTLPAVESDGKKPHGGVQPLADGTTPLLRNFEVTVPPLVDPERDGLRECKVVLSQHVFANSYGQPNVFPYSPKLLPAGCQDPTEWVSIVLEQNGTSYGRQFDRLGSIWLGNPTAGYGLELWRTDNPEPRATGIVWTTRKDVSKYYPLFAADGTAVYDYPNIVDSTYTGNLSMTLSMSVYVPKTDAATQHKKQVEAHHKAHKRGGAHHAVAHGKSSSKQKQHRFLKDHTPDVLIPLSTRQQNAASLFNFGGAGVNDTSSPAASGVTTVANFPRNALNALVEVYASGTAQEEFWYTSVPDSIYDQVPADQAANLGLYPRGPFREVQVLIDDVLAGVALPYAEIFTGGINPLMWRPQSSFGAWDQKTYYVDITPFVPSLSDGKPHDFRLRVVSAEKNGTIDAGWFLSGNVQVHTDPTSTEPTTGKITKYDVFPHTLPHAAFSTTGYVKGNLSTTGKLSATVHTKKPRTLAIEATVERPGRQHKIHWSQSWQYSNKDLSTAETQVINQTASGQSTSTHDGKLFLGSKFDFPLAVDLTADANTLNTTVVHAYDVTSQLDDTKGARYWLPAKSVEVAQQQARADSVLKDGAIASGVGTTSETYSYADSWGNSFFRLNKVHNYTIVQDTVGGSLAAHAAPVHSKKAKAQVHKSGKHAVKAKAEHGASNEDCD